MKEAHQHLADYAVPAGGYMDEHGRCHKTATDLLHVGVLGFCDCGKPDENLRYILRGLALIDEKGPDPKDPAAWNAWYDDYKARERDLFGSYAGALFFAYWATAQDLAEHGGNVGASWLTGEGKRVLGLLQEWNALTTA